MTTWSGPTTLALEHVTDALKKLQIGGAYLPGWRGRFDGSFAGTALPVQCLWERFRAVDPEDYRTEEIEAEVFPGAVVLIEGGGEPAAVFGPVAAGAYAAAGATGVVVNGGSRGCTAIAKTGLRLLTRHETHLSGFGSVRRELVDRVVVGGAEIRRGDLLLGDATGLVVVPAEAVTETIALATAFAAADNTLIAGIEAGTAFTDLWQQSSRNTSSFTSM